MSKPDQVSSRSLCVVLKGYPRLSETFIAQEIRELELNGFTVQIVSLRQPYDPATHPIHDEIEAQVLYLPEYLHQEPVRVVKALFSCLTRRQFWHTAIKFGRDLGRDFTRNRLRRFGQGCVMAVEAAPQAQFFYSHFMHTPSSVTQYASMLRSVPWSISAHAKDIWTIPDWEKSEKLDSAEWLVTCTRSNYEHLTALANATQRGVDNPGLVNLVYHGIDLSRFPAPPPKEQTADGSSEERTVTLLSVGRTVTKKGYAYLLHALVNLPDHLHWKFVHIGGGELTEQLQDLALSLGIDQSISWLGGQPQSVVLESLQRSDLFVLPSMVGDDGDRDGLPNVLMEAQSQKLACLSTNISGIPELIDHEITGWLVDERDVDQLTEALAKLIADPALRQRLAARGYEKLHAEFSHKTCLNRLLELLNQSVR